MDQPLEHAGSIVNDEDYRLHRRFDRIGRLVGDTGMSRLLGAHVAVIGLGGVGSHAAEALCRSGVGRLTLIDFDLVCVTNTNRQVQAMRGTVGRPKATVLAERLRLINPKAEIKAVPLFYEARLADRLLHDGLDYVVDAIDNVTAKVHLLDQCWRRGCPWSARRARRVGSTPPPSPWATSPRPASTPSPPPSARSCARSTGSCGRAPRHPRGLLRRALLQPSELTYDKGQGPLRVPQRRERPPHL